mmetsp:Transcript_61772/g.175443  ORF Transcript_61772/g.175443 Transcript_61772/m.175443 type:complete len:214 (+) Transcript_61772:690-1331(+)
MGTRESLTSCRKWSTTSANCLSIDCTRSSLFLENSSVPACSTSNWSGTTRWFMVPARLASRLLSDTSHWMVSPKTANRETMELMAASASDCSPSTAGLPPAPKPTPTICASSDHALTRCSSSCCTSSARPVADCSLLASSRRNLALRSALSRKLCTLSPMRAKAAFRYTVIVPCFSMCCHGAVRVAFFREGSSASQGFFAFPSLARWALTPFW